MELRRRALNMSESLKKETGVAGAVAKVRQVLRDEGKKKGILNIHN